MKSLNATEELWISETGIKAGEEKASETDVEACCYLGCCYIACSDSCVGSW